MKQEYEKFEEGTEEEDTEISKHHRSLMLK